MSDFGFTVFGKAEPQGSSSAYIRGGRAIVTSANKKMKPYRQVVTQTALCAVEDAGLTTPLAGKHEPVKMSFTFVFLKPASVSKKRTLPSVKPDLDKILRSTIDSLTGVLYVDDAQVVEITATKEYGEIERVEIGMTH